MEIITAGLFIALDCLSVAIGLIDDFSTVIGPRSGSGLSVGGVVGGDSTRTIVVIEDDCNCTCFFCCCCSRCLCHSSSDFLSTVIGWMRLALAVGDLFTGEMLASGKEFNLMAAALASCCC